MSGLRCRLPQLSDAAAGRHGVLQPAVQEGPRLAEVFRGVCEQAELRGLVDGRQDSALRVPVELSVAQNRVGVLRFLVRNLRYSNSGVRN